MPAPPDATAEKESAGEPHPHEQPLDKAGELNFSGADADFSRACCSPLPAPSTSLLVCSLPSAARLTSPAPFPSSPSGALLNNAHTRYPLRAQRCAILGVSRARSSSMRCATSTSPKVRHWQGSPAVLRALARFCAVVSPLLYATERRRHEYEDSTE
eukprot:3454406-Pleurochrysis_carterae.AAC.1